MYQTVGHDVINLYAEAVGLPLFRKVITGKSINTELNYECNEDDEVEDLSKLLKDVQVYSNSLCSYEIKLETMTQWLGARGSGIPWLTFMRGSN